MDDRGRFFPAQQQPYWEHAGHGHPFVHLVLLALVAMALVAVAVWLFRRLAQPGGAVQRLAPAAGVPSEALGIVRMRYAQGEIGQDEFRRMSADLGVPVEARPEPEAAPGEEPTVDGEPAVEETSGSDEPKP
jgi:uncharacterized membrane protein